jgi:uncharacterized alkaline shock family protein YloU
VLIWLEIRRRRPGALRVQGIGGGEAELTVDSVARRLERDISRIDGVTYIEPRVTGGRRGVEVEFDLETDPEVDVPTKTEEICQVTREALEDSMGLKLRNVKVHLRHAPFSAQAPKVPDQATHTPKPPMVPDDVSHLPDPPVVSHDVAPPTEPLMASDDVSLPPESPVLSDPHDTLEPPVAFEDS